MNFDNYYPFSPAELPYSFDALKPHISEYTMYFHHDKHYKGYLSRLNAILEKSPLMQNVPLEALTKMGDRELRRNAGGVYNHEMYFGSLTPEYSEPSERISGLIRDAFGSEKELADEISDMGMGIDGSGWVWLVHSPEKGLELISTPNQETVDFDSCVPILAIDVWEHAYYLDRQDRRREYLAAVMKLLDWKKAEERLDEK